MNYLNRKIIISVIVTMLTSPMVFAEVKLPTNADMHKALILATESVKKSGSKTLTVFTAGGSFSGEFAQYANRILVLKTKTGKIQLKTKKERTSYSFVALDSITGISFDVFE